LVFSACLLLLSWFNILRTCLLQYNVADWLCHIPTDRQEAQKQINGKAENADYGSRKRQAHDYPGGEANMNQSAEGKTVPSPGHCEVATRGGDEAQRRALPDVNRRQAT
jgi:hypothetical protein